MQVFRVDDMTCGHCASSITKAVLGVAADARVEVDLRQQRVRIETARADAEELAEAITDAGYTPVPVSTPADPPRPAGQRSACCGCCG
ncbi:copper chaperone [Pelomonas saccharophila]|uniref:Copper chaperone n=1 Tax=Roseateles saccharophilus TaxID=304 RepID=A0ABU1YQ64_ROSSA|nr:heavy-metal-associated domain-containing protein [Roseateles saccharophilus]MDR7271007.1 copper chaperone [Roseateles saccharophilus]